MPAVSIARLRAEVAGLGGLFTRPAEFANRLRDLLDFYADRVYRAGQNVPPAPLIPMYHTPPLVIQQLQLELRAKCAADPAAGLALADALWLDPYLEVRKLAAFLLGQVPAQSSPMVLERIQAWADTQQPAVIIKVLLADGTSCLRREQPAVWLEMIRSWLHNPAPFTQFLGIQALVPLVEDREFTNFPAVYRMISLSLYSPLPLVLPGLQGVLEILARRSPKETAYFLRQILGSTTPAATIRIIRRLMPLFDPETQDAMRKSLLERPKAVK